MDKRNGILFLVPLMDNNVTIQIAKVVFRFDFDSKLGTEKFCPIPDKGNFIFTLMGTIIRMVKARFDFN